MGDRLDRVLVVGGGIGGMAAALTMLARGAAVELVDLDPHWRVYGAGITITGPTLRAFRDLGLLDAIAEHGFLSAGAHMFRYDGQLLSKTAAPPIEPGLPSSGGIMRPVLHRIMSRQVVERGADVRLGLTASGIEFDDDGARVAFSDGSDGRYDLVIGADGIGSGLRALLFPDTVEPTYTGQMSWRVTAPRPPSLDMAQFYFGHRHIAGITPCSQEEVYAFILHPEPEPRRIAEADQPAFLRNLLSDFGGDMGDLRDGVDASSSIVQRPFTYALQPLPWAKRRAVLIGDAVHATTAHLASGAGLAVEDAIVLARELGGEGGIEEALQRFGQRRFERCRFVVETSVAIGRKQLADAPPPEIGAMMGHAMHVLAEAI